MNWLIIIIFAYLFFSFSSLGDKLVLSTSINPLSYTFYTALAGISVIILLPFGKLSFPSFENFILIISEAAIYLVALYSMFQAVKRFEISRVAPAIGSLQPIFIFLISWLLIEKGGFENKFFPALFLLIIGNFLLSFENKKENIEKYFSLCILSSFLFSIDFILSKIIFSKESFVSGFFWMRVTALILATFLLLSKRTRSSFFSCQIISNKKIIFLILLTYSAGGLANILQFWGISLAPFEMLSVINSLRGLQYFFLFLLTVSLSYFSPFVLKEKISQKVILKKILGLSFLSAGLFVLFF